VALFQTGQSAKSRFCELEVYKAVIGHLTKSAKTGHRGCWRNFPSQSSANGSFSASNLTSFLAPPGHYPTVGVTFQFS